MSDDVLSDGALDLRPELTELGDVQASVLSREQLAQLGVDRNRIRDQVRARRWRLVGRAVVLHRGELTQRQRWWVAVLHVGQGAALASLSAAEACGLTGWEPGQVHVVVENGARVHSLPWIRVHVSRRFGPDDVHPASRPPRCYVARAVVDAASWKPHPRLASAVLAAAVQQRLVTTEQLVDEIMNAGWIRHRNGMLRVLGDIAGGSQALSEIDLLRLFRRAGLPKPERQVVRRDSRGRRRYLDARVTRPDGRVIIVEVDGGLHLRVDHWWDDQARSNDVVIEDDAIIIRFPTTVLRFEADFAASQLRRAYVGKPKVARRGGRHSARPA